MFIVSEQLICCQCKKYLSVKHVKVYPNRGIRCGRCSEFGDAGVVSLFRVLAEQALFRCVNRFEGCNQLLSYSEVAKHEDSCKCKEYDCPCCIETFKGSAYEIYNHFKEKHFDQVLINTSEFILEIDSELVQSYLYRKDDFLFYVHATYDKEEEEIILKVMYLGTTQDASKMSHMFTLHALDGKLKHKTKSKSCCSVTGGNLKCFKININPVDFSKNIVLCRLHLNTENVDYLLALPEDVKKVKRLFHWPRPESLIKPPDFDLTVHYLVKPAENKGFDPVNGPAPVEIPAIPKSEWPTPLPDPFADKEVPSFSENLTFYDKPPITSIPLFPVEGFDKTIINGIECSTQTRLQCITGMIGYDKWSFEELRLSDYEAIEKAEIVNTRNQN